MSDGQGLLLGLSLVVVFVGILTSRALFEFWRLVTPAHAFFIYYIVFVYAGTAYGFLQSADDFGKTFRVVSVGALFFGLGVGFAASYLGRDGHQALLGAHPIIWRMGRHDSIGFWAVFVLGLLLGGTYLLRLDEIPLLAVSDVVEVARVKATRGSGYFLVGISVLLPMACMAFWADYLGRRKGVTKPVAVTCITLLVMLLTALKDLIPYFLLLLFFLSQFTGKRSRTAFWLLPIASLIVALGLSAYTRIHQFAEDAEGSLAFASFAVDRLGGRLFFDVPEVMQFLVAGFPERYEYALGYTFYMNLVAAKPGPDVGFGGWVTGERHPEMLGLSADTVPAIGEFYANLGELGAYLGMLWVGICVQLVFWVLFRRALRTRRVRDLVILVLLSYGLLTMAMNSVFGYLLYVLAPTSVAVLVIDVVGQIRPRRLVQRLEGEHATSRGRVSSI